MKHNQVWFFSRMFPVSQASMMAMNLKSYSGRLPKWGTMHNGDILELQTSAHLTNVNAGSVSSHDRCHTPKANDSKKGANCDPTNPRNGLAGQVLLYPTPNASDGGRGASTNPKYFGETESGALYRQSGKGTRYGMNLTQFVVYDEQQNWGTPRASTHKGVGEYGSSSHQHMLGRHYLEAQVVEENKTHYLNPDWVETLMGFPVGWTDL